MKKNEEILSLISNIDFHYYDIIDYDYDRVQAYDHDERCAGDYCRCSTLENFVVNTINIEKLIDKIKNVLDVEHNLFDKDLIKICEKLTEEDFEFNTSGGYYGEELNSITFGNWSIIEELSNIFSIKGYRKIKINQIINNTENDNYILDEYVKTILTKEYGYILNSIEKSKFKIIEINTNDIVFPQEEYNIFIKKQNLSGYKNKKNICGIVRLVDNKYHVIDGYHRINANINKPTLKVILAYE